MRTPPVPLRYFLLLLALAMLVAFVQVGLLGVAFDKLGLSPFSAILLLLMSLAGSVINLPLFRIHSLPQPPPSPLPPPLDRIWHMSRWENTHTIVALNVGGGLIPVLFSTYLLGYHGVPLGQAALGIGSVAAVSYLFSRPIPGLGIGMPLLIAPLSAALMAMLINPEQSAPLAYISGTLGVLIGADLLRLRDIRRLGAPLASIGGAGTFDGVYITGVVAVLLA